MCIVIYVHKSRNYVYVWTYVYMWYLCDYVWTYVYMPDHIRTLQRERIMIVLNINKVPVLCKCSDCAKINNNVKPS